MYYHHMFSTELLHDFCNRTAEFIREYANDQTLYASRISQRTEQVENAANSQFFTWADCIFHGLMMIRRKQETDTNVTDTAFSLLHVQVKINPSLFQQI